jgi:hypothetical protein
MAAAGTMALAELVADKIPAFDSLWDSFQTFIRIPAGALLAAFAMGEVDPAWAVAAGLVGGTITAGTHFAKAAAGWPSIPRRSLSRTGWPRSRGGHGARRPVGHAGIAGDFPGLLAVFLIVAGYLIYRVAGLLCRLFGRKAAPVI